MKGIKHEILLAVVDFLYLGEANVFQESLDSFLEVAEELRLKGLMGQTEDALLTATQHSATKTLQKHVISKFILLSTNHFNNCCIYGLHASSKSVLSWIKVSETLYDKSAAMSN